MAGKKKRKTNPIYKSKTYAKYKKQRKRVEALSRAAYRNSQADVRVKDILGMTPKTYQELRDAIKILDKIHSVNQFVDVAFQRENETFAPPQAPSSDDIIIGNLQSAFSNNAALQRTLPEGHESEYAGGQTASDVALRFIDTATELYGGNEVAKAIARTSELELAPVEEDRVYALIIAIKFFNMMLRFLQLNMPDVDQGPLRASIEELQRIQDEGYLDDFVNK